MRSIYTLRVIIVFCLFVISLFAVKGQNTNDSLRLKTNSLLDEIKHIDENDQQDITVDTIGGKAYRHMLDSLLITLIEKNKQEKRDKNGLLKVQINNWKPFDSSMSFRDTIIFDPSFLPVVFDGHLLPEDLSFLSSTFSSYDPLSSQSSYHLISPDSTMQPDLNKINKIHQKRLFYYTHNPQDVWVNAFAFDKSLKVKENQIKKSSIFDNLLSVDDPIGLNTPTIETTKIKKTHWKFTGTHSLHISQVKISDSWYGGGNNENSIKNYHLVTLDYKKDRISFDNRIEWKMNLSRISSDDKSKKDVGFTDDFIKIYNVFGVEAFNKWLYSINLETSTPLFKGYKINSNNIVLRNFLSPLDLNLGVGMRYLYEKTSKTDKNKTLKLGIDLSPLSFQYRYIKDMKVINGSTNYGIEDGKHTRLEIGSKIVGNLTYNLNRYANLISSLTFFTNYERVQVDMSNRFNYKLNQYFSIAMDIALRYDDSVGLEKKEKELGINYLQYKESLSFGLTYNW